MPPLIESGAAPARGADASSGERHTPIRPHRIQVSALSALSTALIDGGRALAVMPCGTGKTLVGRWLAEQLHADLVVVCVPSIPLIPQTLLEYRSLADSWPHRAMIVCSDETSGRAVRVDDLNLPPWAREAVTASTSSSAIVDFLSQPTPGARLVVSTYHSAEQVAAALRMTGRKADLLVCDETHHLAGRPRREFRAVLDDRVLQARRRAFLTATPIEISGTDHNTSPVDAPLSLDDETIFGPQVFRAWHAEAVELGIIVDYDVQVLVTRARDRQDDSATVVDAVLAAIDDGASRILTFHSRISRAEALANSLTGRELANNRVIQADHLEARHTSTHRGTVLRRLADPPRDVVALVASARVIGEGINVPGVDTVVFADPKGSPKDIVQAVGRVVRKAAGKTRGLIVIPVALEDSDLDDDTLLASTAWRKTWRVLRALAAMDPRFARTLARYSSTRGRPRQRASDDEGPSLTFTLPAGVDVGPWILRALDRTGAGWRCDFELLRKWTSIHGHPRPDPDAVVDDVRIGAWVSRQRTMYREQLLTYEQIDLLDSLDGWAWNTFEIAWWDAADRWRAFFSKRRSWETDDARWKALAAQPASDPTRRIRSAYDNLADFLFDTCARRRRVLLPLRLQQAATITLPSWQWNSLPEDDAAMVDALDEYATSKRDLNPPHDYRHDNDLPLGSWHTAVRRRRFTGRLSPALDRELALLEQKHATAIRWQVNETAWRLGFIALHQFVTRERTCHIPWAHVEKLPDFDVVVARWASLQRTAHNKGTLSPQRQAALEQQIPGWTWDLRVDDRPDRVGPDCGKRTTYVRGCHCKACCEANTAYQQTRRDAGGTVLVDASKARDHLSLLSGQGLGHEPLAAAASIGARTIANIASGAVPSIQPDTEAAILKLTFEHVTEVATTSVQPGTYVPAGPTWTLLDDIIARNWTKAWIARELGAGNRLQISRDRVTAKTARAVRTLHELLGDRSAPPRGRGEPPLPSLTEIMRSEHAA